MPDFNIKPTHKPIKNYYTELERYAQHDAETVKIVDGLPALEM